MKLRHKHPLPLSVTIIFIASILLNFVTSVFIFKYILWE